MSFINVMEKIVFEVGIIAPLIMWNIWCIRNKFVFEGTHHSLQRVMRRRKELQSEKNDRESYNQNEKGEVIAGNISSEQMASEGLASDGFASDDDVIRCILASDAL
ncbi:transmembrane protein, putative [Medicago truncatula]|uniref:Transmembrane protein, putative n=1 Tax=Medicago truncatula TaxID=3880 RepID=A0A072U8G1_MEDTR|nr:transmembrane protein, putative [Medicago truncatula]